MTKFTACSIRIFEMCKTVIAKTLCDGVELTLMECVVSMGERRMELFWSRWIQQERSVSKSLCLRWERSAMMSSSPQGPGGGRVLEGWQIAADHLLSGANDMRQSALVLGSGSSYQKVMEEVDSMMV